MSIHRLFMGLDRCAPGDSSSLVRACAGLAPGAVVLDAGCGTGADLAALLALVPEGKVTAVDLSGDFIAGVGKRHPTVSAAVADMTDPPGGPFDLIWSGGAIYGPGVAAALAAWRGKLAPGGRVAFTDLVLRGNGVSPEVAAFFAEEGVPLRDVASLQAEVAASGWRCVDDFWLPDSAWDAYYLPLERHLNEAQEDPELAGIIAAFRHEIALWRQHGSQYGYFLMVVVPK
jgi:SAM-dependent methyltransferase